MTDTTTSATETRTVALPQLGESVASGTIVTWLVEVGDEIEIDQPIAEVSTDKVDTEIPSASAGTVTRFLVELDEEVEVGQALLELATTGEDGAAREPDPLPPEPAEAATPSRAARPTSLDVSPSGEHVRLSPLVKRLMRERDLDPAQLTGTGTDGRITPDDVRAADNKGTWPPAAVTTGAGRL